MYIYWGSKIFPKFHAIVVRASLIFLLQDLLVFSQFSKFFLSQEARILAHANLLRCKTTAALNLRRIFLHMVDCAADKIWPVKKLFVK